ncbi:MAG TPA: nucleoside 2-deoxyribosyltransferase [Thermomicrobiales bacterium]|nr:nucleoside 2-deoxyribosyltransferase [Thermomicrobiales bacterium]
MHTLYLASPLGFAAATRPFLAELAAALRRSFVVLNPWDNADFRDDLAAARAEPDYARRQSLFARFNAGVAAANEAAIRRCDFLVAILDGVDVDSGTASEMGFAYGLGKRVYGLRTDSRLTGDNIAAGVNLQVRHWIDASGGAYATSVEDLLAALTRET